MLLNETKLTDSSDDHVPIETQCRIVVTVKPIGKAKRLVKTKATAPSQTELPDDQIIIKTHATHVIGQTPFLNDQPFGETQTLLVVEEITLQWRLRRDMIRARTRLDLQAQAICRRLSGGDKVEGGNLYKRVATTDIVVAPAWAKIQPMVLAMAPLIAQQKIIDKDLVRLVKQLPVYPWVKAVLGFGDISFAGIVGECAAPIGDYKSVAAVWKRMGMAVINGERQRRVLGDAAIEHGYVAERRGLMWTVVDSMFKHQVAGQKDDNGEKLPSVARGPYGQMYLDRVAYEQEKNALGLNREIALDIAARCKKAGSAINPCNADGLLSPAHINNRCRRYIGKALLRDLYGAWRKAV